MNKELILKDLQTIWSILLTQGDNKEQEIGNLLFIILFKLKQYWLGFDTEINNFTINNQRLDKEELFFMNIADFD